MKEKFKEFFKINNKKENSFDAKRVFAITKYGKKKITKDEIYQKWINSIIEGINYKSSDENKYYSFVEDVPKDKEEFLEKVVEYFKSKGFGIFIVDKNTLKNFSGEGKFLLITWDNVELD